MSRLWAGPGLTKRLGFSLPDPPGSGLESLNSDTPERGGARVGKGRIKLSGLGLLEARHRASGKSRSQGTELDPQCRKGPRRDAVGASDRIWRGVGLTVLLRVW